MSIDQNQFSERTTTMTTLRQARRKPPSKVALTLLALIVIGTASGLWAGSIIFQPAEDKVAAPKFATSTVQQGTVGSAISLVATAHWAQSAVGTNSAIGTITTVDLSPGERAVQGTRLYSVDLRPVVLARGNVPAFRDIDAQTQGEDVAQLQQLLSDLGFYNGISDGKPGPRTAAAITRWQKDQGVAQDGVVRKGDVVFVPEVPVRIILDPAIIKRGGLLNGGEVVASTVPNQPDFTVSATEPQAASIPVGAKASITAPDGTKWSASTGDQKVIPNTGVSIEMKSTSQTETICGLSCDILSVMEDSLLPITITTAESVTGSTVPTGSIQTDSRGETFITDVDGQDHRITILASSQGISVVEGVADGTVVRIYSETPVSR